VASPQLRNQGTIGGNLCQKPRCWYYRGEFDCLRKGGDTCFAAQGENQFHCIFGSDDICFIVHPSDTAPPLVALNAQLKVVGPDGERILPVEDLHVLPASDVRRETWLQPGEIIVAIRIPPPPRNLRTSYRKVRARRAWDFALAGVALALQFDGDIVVDGRVVLSGAAPVPWRSRSVENIIRGKTLNRQTIAAAAKAVVEGAQPLAKNAYKIPLFRGVIEEELERMSRPEAA
jgi:xanthine dehydrogenase YagS FAD-binding subunit